MEVILKHPYYKLTALTVSLLCTSGSLQAAGFAISHQGAVGLGNAYAGHGATAFDASTVWANPAAMMELDAPSLAVVANVTAANSEFEDRGSTYIATIGAPPLTGDPTHDDASATFVPNIYYARKMSEKWALGFGVSVPFGTNSSYDTDFVGRYHALDTTLSVIDINPTVAFRINDKVAIGGGISVQLGSAEFGNAIESGVTCFGLAGREGSPVTEANCLLEGLQPPTGTADDPNSADSSVVTEGTSTQLTFNLSALFTPRAGTRIGVAYRNGTDHELEGNADFTLNPALQSVLTNASFPIFSDTNSVVEASLPATFDVSIAQDVNDKTQLLGSLLWTQWSSFDELTGSFDNPAQPDSATIFDWEDAVRVSTGINYKHNQKLVLRAGLAFDQSPVPNPQRRTPRGPANDRYWYSFGGSYQFSSNISLDAGYAHVAIDQSAINSSGNPAAGDPTLRGLFDISANLLALQFNWDF